MSETPDPIKNLENEAAVLGAVLLVGGVEAVQYLTTEVGLRPEHFRRPSHRLIFGAMVALADADDAIDARTIADHLTVAGRLDEVGGLAVIDALAGDAPVGEHYGAYGRRVYRDAMWRARWSSVRAAEQAIMARDEESYLAAEAQLSASEEITASSTWEPDEIRHQVWEYVNDKESDAIPTPFTALNELLFGGLRRGDLTFISGWTSMGKSQLIDGLLEYVATQEMRGRPLRVHLFMNEMHQLARSLRLTASVSGVPFGRLLTKRFRPGDEERIANGLKDADLFGITNCAGWSAERICRTIRAKRWDVVAIDSVNLIPHKGVEEIDAISGMLNAVAQQANCHVLAVGLLRKERANEPILPPPAEGDIRETGRIAYDAANLLFIHRDQEMVTIPDPHGPGSIETGEARKLDTGILRLDKARNGMPGRAYVQMDRQRMRLVDRPPAYTNPGGW